MSKNKTLGKKINELLPELLPDTPELAISGTELINKIIEKIPDKDFNAGTIRNYLSNLSKDSESILAKRPNSHGYYKRPISELSVEKLTSAQKIEIEKSEKINTGREEQSEEKFRSIFKKYYEIDGGYYPKIIEHTKGKKKHGNKGIHKWKYPDLIILKWKDVIFNKEGEMDSDMLKVINSLGDQPFRLVSIELKTNLVSSNYRECFFQCLSNSKWAHESVLAVAQGIEEDRLLEELVRLGRSYGVKIQTFGISEEFLSGLPNADEISSLSDEDFEYKISNQIKLKNLTPGSQNEVLDWEHVSDLIKLNSDFSDVFKWISYCLEKVEPYSFEEYLQELRDTNPPRKKVNPHKKSASA